MRWIPGPQTLRLVLVALLLFTPWVIWGQGAGYGMAALLLWGAGSWGWLRLRSGWRLAPSVTRLAPGTFPVGVWSRMALEVESQSPVRQRFELWEDLPPDWEVQGMPAQVALEPGETRRVTFRVRPTIRGDHTFGAAHLRMRSPWDGWHALVRAGGPTPVQVFPNYAPVVRYALLALQGRQAATGIRKRRMRGTGAEFHQLREYRDGDPITTVDWKATARRTQLIVRDYQEERDQRVAFLLDCGQRMRAFDGGVPLLDHSLHALLLLTYVALQQGDLVSVCSYGGPRKTLGPVQGPRGMPAILRGVYDLQPTRQVSDLEGAARDFLRFEARRTMVVILTQLRPEDREDLQRAHRSLRKRHLVIVASLREARVQAMLEEPIETEADAWRFGAAAHYVRQREELVEDLRAHGIIALDLLPAELPIALASEYLDIKTAGRL